MVAKRVQVGSTLLELCIAIAVATTGFSALFGAQHLVIQERHGQAYMQAALALTKDIGEVLVHTNSFDIQVLIPMEIKSQAGSQDTELVCRSQTCNQSSLAEYYRSVWQRRLSDLPNSTLRLDGNGAELSVLVSWDDPARQLNPIPSQCHDLGVTLDRNCAQLVLVYGNP